MEVASGDEDLESLLQNFHRVSQVLDTSRTAPRHTLLPSYTYTTAARPRIAFRRTQSTPDPFRLGFE